LPIRQSVDGETWSGGHPNPQGYSPERLQRFFPRKADSPPGRNWHRGRRGGDPGRQRRGEDSHPSRRGHDAWERLRRYRPRRGNRERKGGNEAGSQVEPNGGELSHAPARSWRRGSVNPSPAPGTARHQLNATYVTPAPIASTYTAYSDWLAAMK